MAWTTHFCLSLLVAMATTVCRAEDCFRLTAAANYEGSLYLIDGNNFIEVNEDYEEVDTGSLTDKFPGEVDNVEAAFVYPWDDALYFFGGEQYRLYSESRGKLRGPYDTVKYFNEFAAGGLDAVATIDYITYYFKGCEMVQEKYLVGDPESLPALNLPCDIDAAWNHNDVLVLAKGNAIWTMSKGEEGVTEVGKLSDLLSLHSAEVCPDEDPFVVKRRAEQAFEEEHGCVIIDAALTYKGVVYLFNDHRFLTLDDSLTEVDDTDIDDGWHGWSGIPAEEDAAVTWPVNGKSYFFRGASYYRYHWLGSAGPRSNDLWGPEVLAGVDAAGDYNGNSLLFRGCQVLQYDTDHVETTFNAPDVNLPCHIDSAFSFEDVLYVIRGDQVWTWSLHEEVATGPEPLSDHVTLKSWNVCPQREI